MPIFFHLQSHLWIAYLFFFNGLLLHCLLQSYSHRYSAMTRPFESQVLAAFFISISLNGLLLLGLDLSNLKFSLMSVILPTITFLLIGLLFWRLRSAVYSFSAFKDLDKFRAVVYGLVFIILFYNGGLIEQVTDAWWHMSLANKISYASSFTLEIGHLNGAHTRYYPPLWHGNLALAKILSGESLPVLWNSFTAWGAVIKVMGFYLLAFALSGRKSLAVLAALLFVLLPGVGNSYLRVSTWPSHIAYTAWFAMFYLVFYLFNREPGEPLFSKKGVAQYFLDIFIPTLAIIALCMIVYFAHKAELVWFAFAMFAYGASVFLRNSFSNQSQYSEPGGLVFSIFAFAIVLSGLAASLWFLYSKWPGVSPISDLSLAYILPIFFMFCVIYSGIRHSILRRLFKPAINISLLIASTIAILLSVDSRQLLSLFDADMAYIIKGTQESALIASGWLGGDLVVPGWHLQLRYGLLYTGILSIPVSIYMAVVRPNRLSLFCAGSATLAFLICVSPYLYQWLQDILNYHSPWRIALIVFHPIVWAAALLSLWEFARGRS